jgi:hypothetical protein
VREALNNIHCPQWVGRGGPIAWPPRAPQINYENFSLREFLQSLTHAVLLNNEETLCCSSADACQITPNYLGMLGWLQGPMMRIIKACTESHGKGTFLAYITYPLFQMLIKKMKCFRTHVGTDSFVTLVPSICPHLSVTLSTRGHRSPKAHFIQLQ